MAGQVISHLVYGNAGWVNDVDGQDTRLILPLVSGAELPSMRSVPFTATLALTGAAPTLQTAETITAGSLAFTGYAPTAVVNIPITPACGSLNLTTAFNQETMYVTAAGAGTFAAPSDWLGNADSIECIGSGGAGAAGSPSTRAGSGGGGGAYAVIYNQILVNGDSLQVGTGGATVNANGTATFVKRGASTVVSADFGLGATTSSVGALGGQASNCTGTITFNGGSGGNANFNSNTGLPGGGGGGAAGPLGAGANGGQSTTTNGGGGGGGGNGGGFSGQDGSATLGGTGGNNNAGSGGGAGGPATGTGAGTVGTSGGGGGGGGDVATGSLGANGSTGIEWDSTHGSGGGGGGQGRDSNAASGNGGLYGAGGGGSNAGGLTFGTGANGIITIKYTPASGRPKVSIGEAPTAGSLTLTGNAPTLGMAEAPPVGTLALTGYAPSLGTQEIIGDPALVITGHAPVATIQTIPAVGSMGFTGYAPTLGMNVVVPCGSLVLSQPIAEVQSLGTTFGGTAPGTSSNFGAAITLNNTLIVTLGINDTSGIVVTDTLGNKFNRVAYGTDGAGGSVSIWVASIINAGTDAITVDSASHAAYCFHAVELQGVTDFAIADVTGTTNSGSSGTSGSVQTTSSITDGNELAIVVCKVSTVNSNLAITDPPTGYSSLGVQNNTTTVDVGMESAYQIITGTM